MPFKSEKQRRYLWAEHPDIAKRWAREYPESNKNLPMRVPSAPNAETSKSSKPPSKKKSPTSGKKAQTPISKKKTASSSSESLMMPVNIIEKINAYVENRNNEFNVSFSHKPVKDSKFAADKRVKVKIMHSDQPTYAGEEREKQIENSDEISDENGNGAESEGKKRNPEHAINSLLQKISTVLAPAVAQTVENLNAEREGRPPRRVQNNQNVKQYPQNTPTIPPPMSLTATAPANQAQKQPADASTQSRPVGGGSHPQFNPINSFGALSTTGAINGNAAFGAKNSPDSSKIAEVIKRATRSEALGTLTGINEIDPTDTAYYDEAYEEENFDRHKCAETAKSTPNNADTPCSCGCGDTVKTCKCPADCSCRKPGGSCYQSEKQAASWEQDAHDWDDKPTRVFRAGFNLKEFIDDEALARLSPADMQKRYLSGLDAILAKHKKLRYKPVYDVPDHIELDEKTSPEKRREFIQQLWQQMHNERPYLGALGVPSVKHAAKSPAWQREAGKNSAGGLNAKGRASYNKATGGNLKAPVTEKNPKGKRAKRQNSFCSRMCGMKRVNTGSKTKKDPDSRINKSLRKWNCKCSNETESEVKLAGGLFALGPSTNPNDPRVQLSNLVGPQQTQAYQQRVRRGVSAMDKLMGKNQAPQQPQLKLKSRYSRRPRGYSAPPTVKTNAAHEFGALLQKQALLPGVRKALDPRTYSFLFHLLKSTGEKTLPALNSATARQMLIAAAAGGGVGAARGYLWPGYREEFDEKGNVTTREKIKPWVGALQSAGIGAGAAAASNYAAQTISNNMR